MINLKFKSSALGNVIRLGIIVWIIAVFVFKVDLVKLVFKKSLEELKGPNITETIATGQYEEAWKVVNTPIVAPTEIQPPINNEIETAISINETNRIYVPVTIGYHGKMVTVKLMIDTGATGVVISPAIAQKLGIDSGDTTQGQSTVADGRSIEHYNVNVAFVAVGPKTKKPLQINIMPNVANGENGLLGMSFLSEFPHMIDMKAQKIRWM